MASNMRNVRPRPRVDPRKPTTPIRPDRPSPRPRRPGRPTGPYRPAPRRVPTRPVVPVRPTGPLTPSPKGPAKIARFGKYARFSRFAGWVGLGFWVGWELYDFMNPQPGGWDWAASGWQHCWGPVCLTKNNAIRQQTSYGCLSQGIYGCLGGQTFNSILYEGAPVSINSNARRIFLGQLNPAGTRFTIREHWTRPNRGAQTIPYIPPTGPVYDPMFEPFTPTQPYSPPWRRLEPDPHPDPKRKPQYRRPPYIDPAIEWDVFQPRVRPRKTTHKRVPPSPRKPERKLVWDIGKLGKFYGTLTEVDDFIKAVWKALPPNKRCDARTIQDRILCVWRNWKYVDRNEAFWNVIEDNFKDAVFGKLGRLQKKGIRKAADKGYYRSPVGPEFGRRFTQPPPVPRELL